MKRIKIDLNPKKSTVFGENFGKFLSYTPLLALVVVFFALLAVGIGVFSLVKAKQYDNYREMWQQWEPKGQQLIAVKRKLSSLKKEQKKIEEVVFPDITGLGLLEGVFSALSKNIWLEKLYFRKNMGNIKGYVVEWEKNPLVSLEGFINRLQQDEIFSKKFKKIEIQDTKNVNFNGAETTQFVLECRK